MKALVFGFAGFAASAAFAVESPAVATVAVTKVDSSLSNTVVAVSALDLSGGTMSVSNLVKTTNLTPGDTLYAFDNDKYECWTLSSSRTWEKHNLTFSISDTGALTDAEGVSAAIYTMPVGKGIWLSRQDFSKPFYIYGAYTNATASVVPAGAKAALVGNPTQTSKSPVSFVGCANGDEVAIPQAGTLKHYFYDSTGSEGKHWWCAGVYSETLPSISAGTGFWYIPKNKQTVTINW